METICYKIFIKTKAYFPTQNREKMRETISSFAVRPVSSPRASKASSASVSTASGVRPSARGSLSAANGVPRAPGGLLLPLVGQKAAGFGGAASGGEKALDGVFQGRSPPGATELNITQASGFPPGWEGRQDVGKAVGQEIALAHGHDPAGAGLGQLQNLLICVGNALHAVQHGDDQVGGLHRRRERSTPSCSTVSAVAWIPAVSTSRSRVPRTRADSSTVSRVVPAISVTMARS